MWRDRAGAVGVATQQEHVCEQICESPPQFNGISCHTTREWVPRHRRKLSRGKLLYMYNLYYKQYIFHYTCHIWPNVNIEILTTANELYICASVLNIAYEIYYTVASLNYQEYFGYWLSVMYWYTQSTESCFKQQGRTTVQCCKCICLVFPSGKALPTPLGNVVNHAVCDSHSVPTICG